MRIPRTVPMGLLISLPIFGAIFLPKHGALLAGHSIFAKGMLAYGLVVLLSLGAMAGFGEGRWKEFGFQKIQGTWWRFVLYALLLGVVCTLAIKASPGRGMEGAMKGLKPLQIPLLLIIASAAEEFFVRGWLQGFLQPLSVHRVKLGTARISAPVLTGALAFGAMHLPAVIEIDAWTVVFILAFTTSLGLLAGIIRERTGSLLPAIWVHLAGNAGGILGGLIYLTIRKIQGGLLPPLG